MFTGLIEAVAKIAAIERHGSSARLAIGASFPSGEVRLGDSIAVNGICLTVSAITGDRLCFDVSPETLKTAAFRRLIPGSRVNLERALRLSDRLGGHLVTGHVDCVATLTQRRLESGNIILTFRLAEPFLRYVVEKGSIAIDGVSLTVNAVDAAGFSVNIIPHTGSNTTLHEAAPGQEVNIETDILARYVERLLGGASHRSGTGVSVDLLARNGFLK